MVNYKIAACILLKLVTKVIQMSNNQHSCIRFWDSFWEREEKFLKTKFNENFHEMFTINRLTASVDSYKREICALCIMHLFSYKSLLVSLLYYNNSSSSSYSFKRKQSMLFSRKKTILQKNTKFENNWT